MYSHVNNVIPSPFSVDNYEKYPFQGGDFEYFQKALWMTACLNDRLGSFIL